MEQRPFSPWSRPEQDRPRLLIEDPDRALLISDFRLLEESGFDVALCQGPGQGEPCPLVEHGQCDLADAADVVLMGPGMAGDRDEVSAALHRQRPDRPVVVEVRTHEGELPPPDCVPLSVPTSVNGQIRAVWRALDRPATPKS